MNSSSEGELSRPGRRAANLWLAGALAVAGVLAGCGGGDTPRAKEAAQQGAAFVKTKQWKSAVQAYFQAIEADPDYRPAHDGLRALWFEQDVRLKLGPKSGHADAARIKNEIAAQYEKWISDDADSIEVVRAYGFLLKSSSDPRASDLLLKAADHDPKDAEVWRALYQLADVTGDFARSNEYAQTLARLNPDNPDDQFTFVSSLKNVDKARWRKESIALARRFPASERGAQALYWIGINDREVDQKSSIAVFEQLLRAFPPQKFNWASSGAEALFDEYLASDEPKRAVDLAARLVKAPPKAGPGPWRARGRQAQTYVTILARLEAGDARGAKALLADFPIDPHSPNAGKLIRLKTQALAAAGDESAAYNMLLDWANNEPLPENLTNLQGLGRQIGKSSRQVDADLAKYRAAHSTVPPAIGLRDFATGRRVSLSDYRGKVVLLSFWYPNCGPCRAEFPHIDTVVRGIRNADLVYLAPNGYPDEDPLVAPFMKSYRYAFTPLKVDSKAAIMDPEGLGIRGFPSNYIIDRQGRIAYRDFMVTGPKAQELLKARIATLLRDKGNS